jgi:hypothetical protein
VLYLAPPLLVGFYVMPGWENVSPLSTGVMYLQHIGGIKSSAAQFELMLACHSLFYGFAAFLLGWAAKKGFGKEAPT